MDVSLSLKGADIANDGYVDVDDIGYDDDATALLCHTNNIDCCRMSTSVSGNWHFPDKTVVESMSSIKQVNNAASDYFARNGGAGVVRLYRVGNPTDRGHFYCVVPNAAGVDQTIYVNLCKLAIIGSMTIVIFTSWFTLQWTLSQLLSVLPQ